MLSNFFALSQNFGFFFPGKIFHTVSNLQGLFTYCLKRKEKYSVVLIFWPWYNLSVLAFKLVLCLQLNVKYYFVVWNLRILRL